MIRKSLQNIVAFGFRTMSAEDYLFNQRDARLAKRAHVKPLKPLENANQGDTFISDEIQLVGVPKGDTKPRFEDKQHMDIFYQLLREWQRDLIFLQIDPSAYIARQRFMSHRCAMGNVEDYRLDGIQLIDPHKAITWEQTVVNLLTMDMLRENQLPKDIKYKQGLYAYSYPYVQDKSQTHALTPNFIEQISSQILDGRRTGYNMIDKVLYSALMGKHKVMLGGMPETQYRMVLGKGVSIAEMRDVFRLVISKNKELIVPMKMREATENFLPHIFLLPKDLYMTAMLKESFQAAMQMICMVGIQHWRPMQQYWVGPPHGINVTEATRIPQGFAGETTQDLIEKQAMLDVLLETRVWSRNYLSNPFPYLFDDITKLSKQQLDHCKKTFIKHYKLYSEFKDRQLKQLGHSSHKLSLQDQSKVSEQQLHRLQEQLRTGPVLSHLRDKMNLSRQRKIKIDQT